MKNRDTNLSFIYENKILSFAKAQESSNFVSESECIDCCGKNYLSIKGLKDILEIGKCRSCFKETKVFNPFIARQVIQKYGFGIKDYFDVKQKITNDIKQNS